MILGEALGGAGEIVEAEASGHAGTALAPAMQPAADTLPPELAFLAGRHADRASLVRAATLARRWRVAPEQALFATATLAPETYYRALAAHIGLGYSRLVGTAVDWRAFRHPKGEAMARAQIIPLSRDRTGLRVALAPGSHALRRLIALTGRPDAARALRDHLFLATPRDIARTIARGFERPLLAHAGGHLASTAPGLSAANGLTAGQIAGLGLVLAAAAAALALAPWPALAVLNLALSLLFAAVTVSRLVLCLAGARASGAPATTMARIPDAQLPVYTILVPVYREAAVLPHLVAALRRLDYPAAKLDIKLIFEADDAETRAAARALALPACFERIVVPRSEPRNKPRALNYALRFARGSYVAVYDAEDRPEPGQLRAALAAFACGPDRLACVQARLGIYNARSNWLTRQFASEYAGQFEVLLPALHRLRLPIPLGGTSNHFRRTALEAAGEWDAWNVTEDADLGIRLARLGYSCRVIASHTHEEACTRARPWLRQRTRWLKGWMQTWFVHMRAPRRLLRDLGARGFLAFNLLIRGMVLAGLCHPLFLVLLPWQLATAAPAGDVPMAALALVNLWNLVIGYGAAAAVGWLGLRRAGLGDLAGTLVGVPAYWMLISLAAWRALWQFARDRHGWEKTDHSPWRYRLPRRRR